MWQKLRRSYTRTRFTRTYQGLCPRKIHWWLGKNNVYRIARVKDQLLACVISFMWHEASLQVRLKEWYIFVAKNGLWVYNFKLKSFMAGACPSSPSRCVLRAHWMCPCCAHVTCSSWLRCWRVSWPDHPTTMIHHQITTEHFKRSHYHIKVIHFKRSHYHNWQLNTSSGHITTLKW